MSAQILKSFFILALCISSSLASAKVSSENHCTVALLPFGNTLSIDQNKEDVLAAYSSRGYKVTPVTSIKEVSNFEFYADSSVNCTSNYLGTAAETIVRLVEVKSNMILARASSSLSMEISLRCKIELTKAIAQLPLCE